MKINKLKTLSFLLVALLIVSCSKEENLNASFDENSVAKRLKILDINSRTKSLQTGKELGGIIVEWDEWGRASKNCGGWGLCNADWFPSTQKKSNSKQLSKNGGATFLEYDKSLDKYYIDILLSESVPLDLPVKALTFKIDIDFELNVKKMIGKNLTFHKGSYFFNEGLGDYGGYRIYID